MLAILLPLGAAAQSTACIWPDKPELREPDSHVAFRRTFTSGDEEVAIELLSGSPFVAFVDGKRVLDGPFRFVPEHPEYQTVRLHLHGGRHVLAVHAHYLGVDTRMMPVMPPFLWAKILTSRGESGDAWKCSLLPGYARRVARINPQFAWVEWSDSRSNPANWTAVNFDDSRWDAPARKEVAIAEPVPLAVRNLTDAPITAKPIAQGQLARSFGYPDDDPSAGFFLADLHPAATESQGVWRRYDLGRVRLGHPSITLDAPAGSVVEIGLSEYLVHGRVSPWITLSGGRSCNLSHEVASGGPQTFTTVNPRGGRYMELHVISPGRVRFLAESFLEHTYHGEPEGTFECSDPLLNRIWKVGVDSYRSCSEDAVIDSPYRERGQWTGDEAVSLDVAAAAYSDLSLFRRGLLMAGWMANSDGMVAGLGPGSRSYLSTYAAYWTLACDSYYERTGDREFLKQILPMAERNADAFDRYLTPNGLVGVPGWAFVDWGYEANSGPSDMALNIAHLRQLQALVRWQKVLRVSERDTPYREAAHTLTTAIRKWIASELSRHDGWKDIGFQRAVLLANAAQVSNDERRDAVSFIKAHLKTCFPLNPNGPRLADPSVSGNRFFTPYFANFALKALWDDHEGDFALDATRKAWGWMLDQGATTWMEVFDTRWSRCHAWSSCPTWQLTRYVLGVVPTEDQGRRVWLEPRRCHLSYARGTIPMLGGAPILARWKAKGTVRAYVVESAQPFDLEIGNQVFHVAKRWQGDVSPF